MSINYYAGKASDGGKTLEVAYHFDVAADTWTNVAGKTLKECLLEDPGAEPTKSIVAGLDPVEQQKLDSRDLLEVVESAVYPDATFEPSQAARKNWIEARGRTLRSTLRRTLHERYWAWGFTGTVT